MSEVVLEETFDETGKYQGKIVCESEDFTKKMGELWSDEDLASLAEQSIIPLVALKQMPWIAFLRLDIAGKDIQGYKKYKKVLKSKGYNV